MVCREQMLGTVVWIGKAMVNLLQTLTLWIILIPGHNKPIPFCLISFEKFTTS
jgi:hypothetical protein